MKIIPRVLILLANIFIISSVCTFTACKKSNNEPVIEQPVIENKVNFIVNGGAFNNAYIDFNNFNDSLSTATFDSISNLTRILALGQWNDKNAWFQIIFEGKQATTYTYQEPNFPLYDLQPPIAFVIDNSELTVLKNAGFTITEYGNPNGAIKGEFWGTFYDYSFNPPKLVVINNGEFRIKRSK